MKKIYFYLAAMAILLITAFAFHRIIYCELTDWDDNILLNENLLIRNLSFENLKKIFFQYHWFNYYPLSMLTYAVEYHFFGLNSLVIHIDNLFLHLLNVLLVLIFVFRLTGSRVSSFVTALLFAIHPMRVEAVAWAVERRDVLYSLFYLLALIQYIKYVKNMEKSSSTSLTPYRLSFVFFLLSCFSKGMAVSLTLTLPLIDYLLRRKFTRKTILDKLPFLILSLAFGLIVSFGIKSDTEVFRLEERHTMFEKIGFAGYGFLYYLHKFFLPSNLSAFVPYPFMSGKVPLYYLLYPVLCLMIAGTVLFTVRSTRKIVFGFGFFTATIFFVLQLWQTNNAMVSNHYSYLPHIGLAFLVGELVSGLIRIKTIPRIILYLLITVIGVNVLFWCWLTHHYVKVWKNSKSLWSETIQQYPIPIAYCGLADVFYKEKNYIGALQLYKKALSLHPGFARAYNNRGYIRFELKDYYRAEQDFKRAVVCAPRYFEGYVNLSAVNSALERDTLALKYINKAMEIDPDNAFAFYNRGNIKGKMKDYSGSLADFLKSIELNPYDARYHHNCANVYFFMGDYGKAKTYYNNTIDRNPVHAETFYFRGLANLALQDTVSACQDWIDALNSGYMPASYKIQWFCPLQWKQLKNKKQYAFSEVRYPNGKIRIKTNEIMRQGQILKALQLYSPDGNLLEEGIINDSAKYAGEIKWYYPDKKLKITGYYNDTVPYGEWKEYYQDSTLKVVYKYSNGKINGMYKYYYRNGNLWTERMYRDGKIRDVVSIFNIQGKKLDKGTFNNGTGVLNTYDENGKLALKLVFQEGTIVRKTSP